MIDGRFSEARQALIAQVQEQPGHTTPELRLSAFNGAGVSDALDSLVQKIHDHPYKVTDEDIAALRSTFDDDELFEVIVCGSLGGAEKRLQAGLRALTEMGRSQ